ncbi:hypothetical protein [Vibrio crassostreae]|uniref:hypothetical protein n=1 Tax=Vibrio crassostreae TaxID=246167 RepID=UPI001B30E6F6|nr:hypothetical protein [Vibrio crassostreae]
MSVTKEQIVELEKNISEAVSKLKADDISPDVLFPAPKGKKKTSTLLGELDEISKAARERSIKVEDVPETLIKIEKLCLELDGRFNEERNDSSVVNHLIELQKTTKETYSALEKDIEEKIGRFI